MKKIIHQNSSFKIFSGLQLNFSLSDLKNLLLSKNKLAPRTGHLGDWVSMKKNTHSPLSFNFSVNELELGYPLLVTSNPLENLKNNSGDMVYRPGSVVENGKPFLLETYYYDKGIWTNNQLREATYPPLLLVKNPESSKLSNLTSFHLDRFHKYQNMQLLTEVDFLLHRKDSISAFTAKILATLTQSKNFKRDISTILSHLVYPNGTVVPIKSALLDKNKIYLNEISYLDIESLVADIFSFLSLQKNENLQDLNIESSKPFPIFSGLYIFFLECIFQADEKWWKTKDCKFTISDKIQHYHWGARRMAGIPPWIDGYFLSESVSRKIKKLIELTKIAEPNFQSLEIFLLPVAILSLLPDRLSSKDCEILSSYFSKISINTNFSEVHRDFLRKSFQEFSPYFHQRLFSSTFYDNLCSDDNSNITNSLYIPEGFTDVPISFLCETVSFLHELHNNLLKVSYEE